MAGQRPENMARPGRGAAVRRRRYLKEEEAKQYVQDLINSGRMTVRQATPEEREQWRKDTEKREERKRKFGRKVGTDSREI